MPTSALSYRLLCLSLLLAGAAGMHAANFDDPPSELAASLAKKAKAAAKSGDAAQAYIYFSQASSLQPRNGGYRKQAAALQAVAASQHSTVSTSTVAPMATEDIDLPPLDHFDSVTARELESERKLSGPPKLAAGAGRFDFDINDTPRALFGKIAAKYNLVPIFDNDYPQGGTPVKFHMTQVDYREALDAAQIATNSFVVPISSKNLLVAKDTTAKRNDLEQYVVLSVPMTQVLTPAELTEIVQVIRQTTNVEKIGVDTANDQIVIRDRVSRAVPAQALLQQLIQYRPEVMIDLELLQVSDSDVINYGLNITSSFPLVFLGSLQNSVASIPTGVTNLLTFGAGRSLIGIGAAEVQAMFNETLSTGRSIYSARLKAGSGQASTFHVGEKYPIITSGYVGSTSSTGNNPSFTAAPAISWENLGLDLKATPHIHGADSVSMTIEANYEVLTGQSAVGIPVIGTNKMSTTIRLHNDEWAIVAGLISTSDSKSSSGIWGLGSIPFLGNLFRSVSLDKESGSLLIGIRPHITSMGPDENVTQPLRVGNDARPFTPL